MEWDDWSASGWDDEWIGPYDTNPIDVLAVLLEQEDFADFMSLHFEEQRGRYDDYDEVVIGEVIWR